VFKAFCAKIRCQEINKQRTSKELKEAKKKIREAAAEELERAFVMHALSRNDWNATKAAQETGMQRPNFQALIRKHGIWIKDLQL
jgi:transcriptional regulator with GAF, ATPase, and Fis domain